MERLLIPRDRYLQKLIDRRENGLIKVITGLRRCGKSFLLFELFYNYLLSDGIKPEQIVSIALDDDRYRAYRDPDALSAFLYERISGTEMTYILIDEVQYAIAAEELKHPEREVRLYGVLNGLLRQKNVDVYVTGSNSKLLTKDVMTAFRGRGDEVRVYPLSFAEFYGAVGGDKAETYEEYALYGGMPLVLSQKTDEDKMNYLRRLFGEGYFRDIAERYEIALPDVLEELTDDLCSSVGSLTNASKIARTLQTVKHVDIASATVAKYLNTLTESFLFSEAKRYDVKGKRYFDYPVKFYCADPGLRNARLNFRQQEETHLMENVIYNTLLTRGCAVDVGVVELLETKAGKRTKKLHEIDFVVNHGAKKYYIQSALSVEDPEKRQAELRPLRGTGDFFKKIIVTKTSQRAWTDEEGILHLGLYAFLLDENALDL